MVTMVAPVKARTSTPVEVSFGSPGRQRRVTVFFRVVLVIPQAVVLLALGIAAFVVLVVNLLVDISYGWLDPRIRYS